MATLDEVRLRSITACYRINYVKLFCVSRDATRNMQAATCEAHFQTGTMPDAHWMQMARLRKMV